MIINLVRIDSETGERKEIFNLTSEKIKEYAVKAGTFVLVNGLLGKVFPAKRNLAKLVNAGMSVTITKLIFDKIEENQTNTEIVESCIDSSDTFDEVEKGYVKLTPRDDADVDTDEDVKEDADRDLEGDWHSHD